MTRGSVTSGNFLLGKSQAGRQKNKNRTMKTHPMLAMLSGELEDTSLNVKVYQGPQTYSKISRMDKGKCRLWCRIRKKKQLQFTDSEIRFTVPHSWISHNSFSPLVFFFVLNRCSDYCSPKTSPTGNQRKHHENLFCVPFLYQLIRH